VPTVMIVALFIVRLSLVSSEVLAPEDASDIDGIGSLGFVAQITIRLGCGCYVTPCNSGPVLPCPMGVSFRNLHS
jgi:hypothetical protein